MGYLAIWLVVLILIYILLSIAINYSIYLFWEDGLKVVKKNLLFKIKRSRYILKSMILGYRKSFYEMMEHRIKNSKQETQLAFHFFYVFFKKWLSSLPYGTLFLSEKQKH
ncbi:MAG: hypothetical protein CMO01_15590 [Thalassobius sp.]|nr:hypothetical protein [Thalassovita sp.]